LDWEQERKKNRSRRISKSKARIKSKRKSRIKRKRKSWSIARARA